MNLEIRGCAIRIPTDGVGDHGLIAARERHPGSEAFRPTNFVWTRLPVSDTDSPPFASARKLLEKVPHAIPADHGFAGLYRHLCRLIDGGVWANNPLMLAIIEAMICYKVPRERIKVLSIGCGDEHVDEAAHRP